MNPRENLLRYCKGATLGDGEKVFVCGHTKGTSCGYVNFGLYFRFYRHNSWTIEDSEFQSHSGNSALSAAPPTSSLSHSSFCFDFRYSHARSVYNFRSHIEKERERENERGGTEMFTVLPFANISFISQLYCCSFTVFRFNCPFHILGTAMKPLTGEQSDGGVEICRSSIVWIASSFAIVRIPLGGWSCCFLNWWFDCYQFVGVLYSKGSS